MSLSYAAYVLIGRLLIFLVQRFPLASLPFIGKFFREGKSLEKLFSCDLCLGFWVYLLLSLTFRIVILQEFGYFPVLSEIITAAVSTFLMWLLATGWKDHFTVMEIG